MSNTDQVEIKLSKKKMKWMLIGAGLFFGLGIWMLAGFSGASSFNPMFIKVMGLLGTVFFGASFIFLWRKINDEKPGLVINQDGIIDNSSGVSAGDIPWSDIVTIKTQKVFNQHFIMLMLRNPNVYIEKQTNTIKKKAMELNFKNYGSPISISANTLECKFEELKHLLDERFNIYKYGSAIQ
ncbi:MAG: STM3941 family protein [Agriterribacter sp.]